MDDILGMLKEITVAGGVEVAVEAETPVIKDGDKTTEVKPDGTVKNSDPAGTSSDSPDSNDSSKSDPSADSPAAAGGAGGKPGGAGGKPSDPSADSPAAAGGSAAAARGRPAQVNEPVDEADPISDAPLAKGRPAPKSNKAKGRPATADAAVIEENVNYDIYDIGFYDVYVDQENKATIRTKKKDSSGHGMIKDKEEKVKEG